MLLGVNRPIRIGAVLERHLEYAGAETLQRLGDVGLTAFGRYRQRPHPLYSGDPQSAVCCGQQIVYPCFTKNSCPSTLFVIGHPLDGVFEKFLLGFQYPFQSFFNRATTTESVNVHLAALTNPHHTVASLIVS